MKKRGNHATLPYRPPYCLVAFRAPPFANVFAETDALQTRLGAERHRCNRNHFRAVT